MNADNYPPINVLSAFRGVPNKNLHYPITPYRFEKTDGSAYKIHEIRQFYSDRRGKGQHFHFVVVTENEHIFRILFDTNTFTWRLVDEVAGGRSVSNG